MRAYKELYPDAAHEFFALARRQAEHRQMLEAREQQIRSDAMREHFATTKRGQRFGLTIALFFGAASAFLIYTHHDVAGSVLGSVDLVSLVSIFIAGRFNRDE